MLKSPFMGEGAGTALQFKFKRSRRKTVQGAKRQLVLTSSSNTTMPNDSRGKGLALLYT